MDSSIYSTTALDFLPLWGVFTVTSIIIVIAIETGYALGKRRQRRLKDGEQLSLGGGVAATLGLLAFMLAFTFSSGTSRWDTKKELILAESNALATAFLRADLLPEPYRGQARNILAEYTDQRIAARRTMLGLDSSGQLAAFTDHVGEKIGESKDLQVRLWQVAVGAAEAQPSPITALFINAVNEVLDLHQMRVTVTFQQRMPKVFWMTLYVLAVLAMGMAGYEAGATKGARALVGWVIALAFASVILLVVALDRPQVASVSYAPMLEVQTDMHKVLGRP